MTMNHKTRYRIEKFMQPRASCRVLLNVILASIILSFIVIWALATIFG